LKFQKHISAAILDNDNVDLPTEISFLVDHGLSDEALKKLEKLKRDELMVELDTFGWPFKSKMNKGDLLNALLCAYAFENTTTAAVKGKAVTMASPNLKTTVNKEISGTASAAKEKVRFACGSMVSMDCLFIWHLTPIRFEISETYFRGHS
jgi:hypothetical protein